MLCSGTLFLNDPESGRNNEKDANIKDICET